MTSPLQQKLKITGPVVITANRLGDGAVVYRSADGRWTKDLAAAAVVTTTPAAIELLTAALADKLSCAPVQHMKETSDTQPANKTIGVSVAYLKVPFYANFIDPAASNWIPETVVVRVQSPAGPILQVNTVKLRRRTAE